jgi:hypothetical protein
VADRTLVKVLSIDGGGIRGIIPAGVSDSLDDASAANIRGLAQLAKNLIKDDAARIAAVCKLVA